MKIVHSLLVFSLLSISFNVYSQENSQMPNNKNKDFLERGKELSKEMKGSDDPEKREFINKYEKLSKIKTYSTSKTLAVVVDNCARVKQGQALKQDFDKWMSLAKNDIHAGYEIIKDGFEDRTYEEIDASITKKVAELENKYSDMDETTLIKECKKFKTIIAFHMSSYQ